MEWGTNSRIHHFLPECIAYNLSALSPFLTECIVSRTTRECHTVEPSSFFAWIPVRKVLWCCYSVRMGIRWQITFLKLKFYTCAKIQVWKRLFAIGFSYKHCNI